MNDSNLTATATPFPPLSRAKQTELTAWIATTLTISFVGALNNILTLRVTRSAKLGKAGVNLLIFHFVAINLLMCLVTLPIAIFIMLAKRDGWFLPMTTCGYFNALFTTNLSVINWSDAGLALNRLVALYLPHRYKAWSSTAANRAIIMGSWLTSLGIALPFTFSAGGQGTILSVLGLCNITATGPLGAFLSSMITYVSYAISGTGSLLILWKCFGFSRLRTRDVVPDRSGNAAAKYRTTQRRLNMAKMLLLTFLWNGICAFPAYVINRIFPYLYGTNPVSVMWVRTLTVCQYAFTPVSLHVHQFSDPFIVLKPCDVWLNVATYSELFVGTCNASCCRRIPNTGEVSKTP
ncbi:hypothetical protein BV898_18366 [Hypsibius exemplaris]|uniref:G-protein coupled receptors family 1 profile domain-containing protein n=1 Tax=Hypsibius exemplaris TaxID=2072580 RepID=A0A9X6NHA6_HYPEX|nr:hypothetical protein BV898_18366 [Hypsibius exemplaris]